ncbi:hypothetical protein KCG44_14035 [Pacificimonas sp. WHA3]|uniref:Lipoprotein n=1 Tax=Pacificimonas pallii TaxID=2827236 RepID=A0ABS6SHT1_9SPHN|nr:hypothetical protein [Pacificimonas pallii]MBV7257901.1 hypothetical protein [Pacificimonas pallii]
MRFAKLLPAAAITGLVLTTACRPHPDAVEMMLGAKGLSAEQASCVATGLDRMSDDDWATLAALAVDAGMSRDDFENMTIGDLKARLALLGDGQLVMTVMRTGLGCMIMYGGTETL